MQPIVSILHILAKELTITWQLLSVNFDFLSQNLIFSLTTALKQFFCSQ